jgi:hypothetical protein
MEGNNFLPSLNLSTSLFTRCDHAQWLCQLNYQKLTRILSVPTRQGRCRQFFYLSRQCANPRGGTVEDL